MTNAVEFYLSVVGDLLLVESLDLVQLKFSAHDIPEIRKKYVTFVREYIAQNPEMRNLFVSGYKIRSMNLDTSDAAKDKVMELSKQNHLNAFDSLRYT